MSNRVAVSKSVTATGQFTDALTVLKGERFTCSVSGIAGGSVVEIQRNMGGAGWRKVKAYTSDAEEDGIAGENMELRLGCPTSFGTGTVECRLGK